MGIISDASGRRASAPAAQLAVRSPAAVTMADAKAAYEHTLQGKMAYARLLATSGLLPRAYQKNPANVLWALEYGEALSISPVVAMLGIHVIDGRPAASAALISGLVRRAGHKLRLRGNDSSATCEIIRADDPEYTFSFTWDMKRAAQAGLTGKDNWKKTPAAMLQARATTECARAACQDVLFGLAYTPEELGSELLEDELANGVVESVMNQAAPAPVPAEDEPKATPAALRRVSEAFTAAGWDTASIEGAHLVTEAVSVLIDREVDGDLTADEAEFVAVEVEGFAGDIDGLVAMLNERRESQ